MLTRIIIRKFKPLDDVSSRGQADRIDPEVHEKLNAIARSAERAKPRI